MSRLYIGLLLLLTTPALAQNQPPAVSLAQVIELALSQSAVAQQAATSRDQSYWQWRGYQANYRPQLGLQGTLPGFSRAVTPVVQPDGTTDFRAVRINNSNLALTLTQNIGRTGGQVFVASELQRFDDFNGGLKRYNNQPVAIGLTQPLGSFNNLKWARRLEPLRYQESQRLYVEERETIAQRVTELYFDVLQQQVNAEVASQNVQANEELLRIGQERYQLGRLSQSDVLRLELNLLNARQAVAQGQLDAQNAAVELQMYTGLPAEQLRLAVPEAAPRLAVPAGRALAEAQQHRSVVLAFRRRLLEAERTVALARGSTGFQATLAANLGYVNQASNLWDTYAALQNQQQVRLTFALPLVDWGRQKSIIKTAELTRRQVQTDVAQEEASFALSVEVQAAQLSTLAGQLALTARADTLAQQRYAIAQATYKVGRISLTDLTIASAEKDQARRTYILALRAAWVAHYRLRALTLYDFERQQPLAAQ
ncbi:TolC family protein [Hymenobacter perfusus]|uniref:TolC family protein n=1 Tax=Hymenobacter perfusus TaxID=1236770 RepID=UPI001FE98B64|nr:TolC family protein [Hymenobacter perfusus]